MRLWPKSLAGQMLLLVAAALFVAQAINFTLLLREVQARRANFTEGGAIARTVDALERMAAGVPVGGASDRGPRRIMISTASPAVVPAERDAALEARLRQALAEAGLSAAEVRAGEATDGGGRERLIIAVRLPDARWVTISNRLPRGERELVMPLLGQTLILFVALLVAVILLGRHVARPLRRLNEAAQSFGTGGRNDPVPLEGPADVSQLIATFNQMRSRILDMLGEKDRMLGAIGHDLRTPLASLRLRAETVEDEAERERMIATVEEMGRTLEDILSLARLGRSAEEPVRVDLAALVDALAADLQDLGQAVTFEGQERFLAWVRPVLMRRALRNLIENAVTYGERAELRLRREGASLLIEIDDEGPGIPEESLEHVMDGFVRLDESRNRATGGSGLGLTIARSIIHEHGGSMRLENLPDRGLRATVRLPLES